MSRRQALVHLLLTAPRRSRRWLSYHVKGAPGWRLLQRLHRVCAPLWTNPMMSSLSRAIKQRLYTRDPRGYWQAEGGRKYLQDEAFLVGPGSMSELQGRFLAAEIQALGAGRVLEVGCGYGRMLKELSGKLAGNLYGADFSEPQLVLAHEYLSPSTVPVVLADATQGLPFRDGSFDVVYTQGCLMHVPPPSDKKFRSELTRVSRRYIIHTEEFRGTVHTFAQDSKAHYEPLGYEMVKVIPYPLSPQGQHLTFEIFEKRASALTDSATRGKP